MTHDDSETVFASLLASRLCHDLVNPAGALSTALDVLENESDADMREHADRLAKESTHRLLAVIEYARLAYGASGGGEGEIDTETMRQLAERLYTHLKPELIWELPAGTLPKREARALLNLLLTAERIAPRAGSKVYVGVDRDGLRLTAEGRKASLPADVAAAFAGSDENEEPKLMPARLAYRLARAAGRDIAIDTAEERVVVALR
jgi:histidine phosphotransferase ChpT